jgi:hypothetical protein
LTATPSHGGNPTFASSTPPTLNTLALVRPFALFYC